MKMKTILSDIFFGVGLYAVASFHGYRHHQKRISLVAISRKNAAWSSVHACPWQSARRRGVGAGPRVASSCLTSAWWLGTPHAPAYGVSLYGSSTPRRLGSAAGASLV